MNNIELEFGPLAFRCNIKIEFRKFSFPSTTDAIYVPAKQCIFMKLLEHSYESDQFSTH